MKKIILTLCLLSMAGATQAEELFVIYDDVITAADSNTVRTNIVYSKWADMGSGRFLNYGVVAESFGKDTNWVDDSLFYELEMKFGPSSAVVTLELDTLLDVGSATGVTIFDADATVLPAIGRLKVTHWDSIGTGDADSALVANSTYTKKLTLWFNWR